MKKIICLNLIILILIVLCIVTPTLAQSKQFSMLFDSNSYYSDIPMQIIDNKTYVQLRPFCEEVGFEVDWIERGEVILIDTLKREFELDNDIGREVAMMIGSALLDTQLNDEFLNKSEIHVKDYEDYYSVFRYVPGLLGGGFEVQVRKYDGKVIDIVPGE